MSKKNKINISVIIPIYNCENYLSRCIESVLNQTYEEFELILINDGSTDQSYEICKKYKKIDDRIKVVNKENMGVSHTRNQGIEQANGEYIIFVDSDDWIESSMLEKMYCGTQGKKIDMVICGTNIVSTEGVSVKNLKNETFLGKEEISDAITYIIQKNQEKCVWNKMYRKSILQQNKIYFREDIGVVEDAIFNFNYFKYINSMQILENSYYNYNRIVDTSINLRYLPYRCYCEHEMFLALIELFKYYKILEKNKFIINQYQMQGILISIQSINHPDCKYSLVKRYLFIKDLINKYSFYNFTINKQYTKNFSEISNFILLSENPLLIFIYSIILKIK